jgi:hypothetical protein
MVWSFGVDGVDSDDLSRFTFDNGDGSARWIGAATTLPD